MLGFRLMDLRKATGKTQAEIAAYLGITRPAYTAYESGRRQPDYATLRQIADYYKVTLDYLLGGPSALGRYIAKKRSECGKSPNDLAEEACVVPQLLEGLESGAVGPSDLRPEELDRLAEALKVSTMDLILCRDRAPYDVSLLGTERLTVEHHPGLSPVHEPPALPYTATKPVCVPVLGKIKAGGPVLSEENVIGYEMVRAEEAQDGDHFYLRVKDDGLIGSRIREGDLAFISQHEEIESGAVGVVLLGGEEAALKRAYFQDGMVILQDDDLESSPVIYPAKDVKFVGKVKHVKFWL